MEENRQPDQRVEQYLKLVDVPEAVWPTKGESAMSQWPWIESGRYPVIREFDAERYVIRVAPSIVTLVKKSQTRDV